MNYARFENEENKPGVPLRKSEVDRIEKLFDGGMSANEIAHFIGRAPCTVLRYLDGRTETTYPPVSADQRSALLIKWRLSI